MFNYYLCLFLLSGCLKFNVWAESKTQTMDVLEGENVLLECRFSPLLAQKVKTVYWIRINRKRTDNVAIGDIILEKDYMVDNRPQIGIYDLRITNATYDRDNGQFECRIKEKGDNFSELHSKSVDLTVLLKPSKPNIGPTVPVATEGQILNLTCASTGGSPPPQIHWYKKGESQSLDGTIVRGKNKDEETTSVLSILPTKQDDLSSYKCTVWNRALGQLQNLETFVTLTVNYFPRVSVYPETIYKIEKGNTATLECIVDSKPSVSSVKWSFEKMFIDTSFKHSIPRIDVRHSGIYSCAADNGLGQTGSSSLQLDVLVGPSINLPSSEEVNENDNVLIECIVTSNPLPYKIEWFKENVEDFKQEGSQLKLNGVKASMSGNYICSASNRIEATGKSMRIAVKNSTIAIHVRHKPGKAFITPRQPIAVEGKAIVLKCSSNPPGFPAPHYTWTKEDIVTPLAHGSELVLDTVRSNHRGKYYCQAKNDYGQGTSAFIHLEVHQAPKITTPLQPMIMKTAGDSNFHVSCGATGKPLPKVNWYKDGNIIRSSESNMYQIHTTEQESLIASNTFDVLSKLKFVGPERISANQLMPTDRGHYTCQFENEVDISETIMLLRIEHSPVVIHQHNRVAFDQGETAYISCKMQAFPSPRFDWSYGNSILQNNQYDMNTTNLSHDVYESVLKIHRVLPSSYGDYNCKAMNSMGSKKTVIKLQARSKPETPSHVLPLETGYNFVTIGWHNGFNGGYQNTSYIIQFRKHDEMTPHYQDCKMFNPCNITNLKQHSQYHVIVKASNDRGESKFSNEITLVTKIDVSQIPTPNNVHYEKSTNVASFNLFDSPLELIAKIELENSDGTWSHYDQIPLKTSSYGEIVILEPVSNLRVRFCLRSNALICGPYEEGLVVDVRPNAATSAAMGEPWVIGLSVCIIIFVLILSLILLKCCWCRRRVKSLKSESHIHRSKLPSYSGPNYGLEKETKIEALKESSCDEESKTNIYLPHNCPEQQSNSNSVNSQDSLWNLKNHTHFSQTPPGYDILIQPLKQQSSSTLNENNYTHYPYPEEYINDRNRTYLAANGDPYSSVTSKGRIGGQTDYLSYSDVNGLPNHSCESNSNSDLPSQLKGRRIIREIIV